MIILDLWILIVMNNTRFSFFAHRVLSAWNCLTDSVGFRSLSYFKKNYPVGKYKYFPDPPNV